MSANRVRREQRLFVVTVLAVVCLTALPRLSSAQASPPADRDALVRLAEAAGAKGLPTTPLMNKIREGLAKGHDPRSIELVIGQMVSRMESADRLVRDLEPGAAISARDGAITVLAEAFEKGLTTEEVRELHRQAQVPALSSQDLAGAAKGLSFIKEAKLPVGEGTAVMAEALRQKFRPFEMQDLGREIKRREPDYRSGRTSLRAVRDAIAGGTRPETLLRDSRTTDVQRPAATRPGATADRPQRPVPAERPDRPADRPSAPGGDRTR